MSKTMPWPWAQSLGQQLPLQLSVWYTLPEKQELSSVGFQLPHRPSPAAHFVEQTAATSKRKQFHICLAFRGSPEAAHFGQFLLATKENTG